MHVDLLPHDLQADLNRLKSTDRIVGAHGNEINVIDYLKDECLQEDFIQKSR